MKFSKFKNVKCNEKCLKTCGQKQNVNFESTNTIELLRKSYNMLRHGLIVVSIDKKKKRNNIHCNYSSSKMTIVL